MRIGRIKTEYKGDEFGGKDQEVDRTRRAMIIGVDVIGEVVNFKQSFVRRDKNFVVDVK